MRSIYDPMFAAMPAWQPLKKDPPFRARGVLYQRDLARIQSTVRGGLTSVLDHAANPALAAYFKQSFASHRFYDVLPLVIVGHVAARLRGMTIQQFTREGAKDYAAASLAGLTGLIVQRIPLAMVGAWLPKASAWFNDFGAVETSAPRDRVVRATRTSLPGFMVLGWAAAGIEFTEAVFRHCGARDVRIYPLAVEEDGAVDGTTVYRVSFEVAWSD